MLASAAIVADKRSLCYSPCRLPSPTSVASCGCRPTTIANTAGHQPRHPHCGRGRDCSLHHLDTAKASTSRSRSFGLLPVSPTMSQEAHELYRIGHSPSHAFSPTCAAVAPALSHSCAAVGNSKRCHFNIASSPSLEKRRLRKKSTKVPNRRGSASPLHHCLPHHPLSGLAPVASGSRLAPIVIPGSPALFPSVSSSRRVSVVPQLFGGAFHFGLWYVLNLQVSLFYPARL
ncbi:hypothetical protein K438DRAFT_775422 [Mycena galopus ATCC 62051]|nr:hypothetical protein K438DRAFT_775422 [Mycena galopus ATCC 62051]